jgi:hypothetical protein
MTNCDETVSFEEVKSWLRAAVGTSMNVHIVNQTGTIAFLDGSHDRARTRIGRHAAG